MLQSSIAQGEAAIWHKTKDQEVLVASIIQYSAATGMMLASMCACRVLIDISAACSTFPDEPLKPGSNWSQSDACKYLECY